MDINTKPLILWIVYYILGLDGFRIGNPDSLINSMQMDKSRMLRLTRQYSHVSTFPVTNRLKRFFEFNPVAFNRKSPVEPDQTLKTTIQFSPFTTSLQNFKESSGENDAYLFTKFKSSYINNDEKTKFLRPYVDHFSGVKSFPFHLKNPKKEKLKSTKNKNIYKEEPSLSKLIEQTFLKPKTKQLLKSENLKAATEVMPLKHENMENDFNNENLNGISKPENNDWTIIYDNNDENSRKNIIGNQNSNQFNTFNHDYSDTINDIDMFQEDTQNYAPSFSNDTLFEAIAPKLKKFPYNLPEYDSVTDDNLISSFYGEKDSAETTDKGDLHHLLKLKQHQSQSKINDDDLDNGDIFSNIAPLQSLDIGFDPFGELIEPTGDLSQEDQPYSTESDINYLNNVMTNIQGNENDNIKDDVSVDYGFGDFGIFENQNNFVPNNDELNFVDIKTENTKPYFGIEETFENDFIDPSEDGFGSFSYDDVSLSLLSI